MSQREPGSNQNTIKGFLRKRKGDWKSNLLSQPLGTLGAEGECDEA
jgi:hypothetical protein